MADLARALLVKHAVQRRLGALVGVAGVGVDVGIDVRAGPDFAVRVTLSPNAPQATLDQIPDSVDDVAIRKAFVPPFQTE